MGDMTDLQIEQMFLNDFDGFDDFYLPGRGDLWITRDGRGMQLKNMTESHIKNCHAMLQKMKNKLSAKDPYYRYKEDYYSAWQELFEDELSRRK